ncbi:hypothetical protein J5491_02510 [Candidatus Saccharibacteria bacterium]|nr:hypothetical protein [Candidatus Saccharibacteria bacterium]
MQTIDINQWERQKTYLWFKEFSNSTYGMNVRIDVTKLLKHTREKKESFFIDLLYIVVKSLDSVEEMRMRLVDGEPVIYDDVTPAYTVMTEAGVFENVRHEKGNSFKEFYEIASREIESAKKQSEIKKENYNPENCYSEYYITCVPWADFTSFKDPIPDDKSSASIPRVCWGKYTEKDGKYELTMSITVDHMFVDGYPLAMAFNKIQELLNSPGKYLK